VGLTEWFRVAWGQWQAISRGWSWGSQLDPGPGTRYNPRLAVSMQDGSGSYINYTVL
jgi:hypothetical protein